MKLRPGNKRVLIRLLKYANTGYGQTEIIVVPENHEKEISFFGQVLGCGPKCVEGIQPGEYALVDTYRQYAFETGNKEDGQLLIVEEADVSATLDGPPENYIDIVPTEARELAEVA